MVPTVMENGVPIKYFSPIFNMLTIFMIFFLKISSSALYIYSVLLFSLSEDVSEVAIRQRSAK